MRAYQKEMTEDEYKEMLDDAYGTVSICGITFDAGRALKELDPTAFCCGMSEIEDQPWICDECVTEHDTEEEAEECCEKDN